MSLFFKEVSRILKPKGILYLCEVYPMINSKFGYYFDRGIRKAKNVFGKLNSSDPDYEWQWEHYPLQDYFSWLKEAGFSVDTFLEPEPDPSAKQPTVMICPGSRCKTDPEMPCATSARLWDENGEILQEYDYKKDRIPEDLLPLFDAKQKQSNDLREQSWHWYLAQDYTPLIRDDEIAIPPPECFGQRESKHEKDPACLACPRARVCRVTKLIPSTSTRSFSG